MTDAMTPAEKIQAAIDKLEKYRSYPVPDDVGDALLAWGKRGLEDARAAYLIAVLSGEAVIDAQLAILRAALHYVSKGLRFGFVEEHALALADAILGEDS